jgi:FlaA1/EpsC-like NDP-sugar epimerase
MIELSGMVPDKDIAIEYSGLKPGEKMTEILASGEEELDATVHEKLFLLRNSGPGSVTLDVLDEFIDSVRSMTHEEVRTGIQKLVPDYVKSDLGN